MELILTRPDATVSQVTITCDGQPSHTFDLFALIPTKANGLPHPFADPITYGTNLYTALFPPDSLAQQALAAKPKRIVLVTHDDVLDAIPWEYAYGSGVFLACGCSMVRGLPAEERTAPPDILSRLHIVALASSPLSHTLSPLNIQGEWTRLTEIVGEVDRAVTLERAWPPTIERLRDLLAGERERVVHFMGHGGQNDEGEAVLRFEQDNGTREDVTAREFVQRVQESVFLVTLNACQSATPSETGFGNLAKALVREQVPYAVGMRFLVVDDDARAFARAFYRNLSRSISVEEALRQARLTLAKSERAWAAGNLVLYTSLTAPAPGATSEPGKPDVRDAQEEALRGIISVLPAVQGAFQGRIDGQIQLGTWLTGDHRPRIITIHGSGGQGKTALARVAAERFAHAWPGGVWAITLETVPTRAVFVASLARFLEITPQDVAELADLERQVLLRLHRRRTLLVLDNVEMLDEAAKAQDANALALVEFIHQLPGERTSLLCTSRHLLGWSGEHYLELAGLSPDEGAALFQQSAPNHRIEGIDLPLACELSRRVDGHPHGLLLLGKVFNATLLPLAAFLADYETFLSSAENRFVGVDHRQRSLYANVAYSVKWLPPDLRNLFSKLWLFHAPFLLETAIAILDPDAETRKDERSPVADQLHALWQRSLLIRGGSSEQGVPLYRVPPVIRLYIERYLADESERTPLLARYGNAYARVARSLYRELKRGALAPFLAVLCYDDLERGGAQVTGLEQGYYLLHWGWILQQLGDRLQGLALTEQALEAGQELDQNLMMEAMNNMAEVYRETGHPQEALRLYEQALPLVKEVGDRAGEASALNNMALAYHATGRPDEALRLYELALLIQREVGDRDGEARTLTNMAGVYQTTGQPQEALRLSEQALPLIKEVGDRAGEARTLTNMARVYRETGQPQEALRLYKQALPIAEEVGDRAGVAATLTDIARGCHDLGLPVEALRLYELALPIAREIGNRDGEALILNNIALVYQTIGHPQEALRLYKQALSIAREIGNRDGEARTLTNMAGVYHATGRPEEALRLSEQALPLIKEVGDRDGEAATLTNMAGVYQTTGQPQDALRLYEQALPIAREVGNRAGEASALNNMAGVYHATGRPQEALRLYEQGLLIQREVGDRDGEARTLTNMAGVYQTTGQPQDALRLYEQALSIMKEVGDRDGEATTLNNMAGVYRDIGRPQEALHLYGQTLPIMKEVGNRAGEARTLVNMAILLYQDVQRPQEAIANMEQALAILGATSLPQDAAGRTPEQVTALLQAMRDGTFSPGQESSASTIPAEQIEIIVGNTIVVMTTMPERRTEWREAITQALQDAHQRGSGWQSDVEFFTAILALLDGQSPTLSADHPYAQTVAAIQNGIAKGGLVPDEGEDEDNVSEEEQALPITKGVGNREGEAARLSDMALWYRNIVLRSLNTVTKETAMMARELGRSSPDPRLGSMVELSRGNARGLLDFVWVGKALPGQGIAAEEPPPALLQVEPARSCRNEDVVEAWMRF